MLVVVVEERHLWAWSTLQIQRTPRVLERIMGRKTKKPFIDKKQSQTFRLVPRSQHDPLCGDSEAAQHVLQPGQDRVAEQQKYGILYSDDYDYLQHLREPGSSLMEPGPTLREPVSSLMEPGPTLKEPGPTLKEPDSVRSQQCGEGPPNLPAELFGSELVVLGKLEKVLPVAGPQPHWDPDIVAALEGDNETFELSEELDDDFVLQANGGEPGVPVYVTEHWQDHSDEETGPAPSWWETRGDFTAPDEAIPLRSKVDSDQSDNSSTKGEKSARFTQLSMTSSVVPRSEALTLLDDRFEQFLVTYDDSEIGPGVEEEEEEEEGAESTFDPTSQLLLQHAVEEFEKNFSAPPNEEGGGGIRGSPNPLNPAVTEDCDDGETSEGGDSSDEETSEGGDSVKLVEVVEAPKDQWDCETILSTHSTLYNHPTLIPSPPTSTQTAKVRLSRKSGVPLATIAGPAPREKLPKKMPIARPRNESREEKQARKQSTKQERRVRRADKKATKVAFKSEELLQERALHGNQTHTITVG